MKRLLITEEDKRHILSLYSRNDLISERTVCGENDMKLVEPVKERINKLLPIAINFWRQWLENPVTKEKIKNGNNFDDNKIDEVYKQYFDLLNNVKLVYVGFCTEIPNDNGFYAWVTQGDSNHNVYVSLWNNIYQPDVFIEETLVHEIQHMLYFIQPMSPELKIDNCFNTKTKNKVSGLKNIISKLFGSKNKPKINLDGIISNFGIDKVSAKKVNDFFNLEVESTKQKGKEGYILDTNEAYSRIMELRKKFNINPGENLTTNNFKPFIDELLKSTDYNSYFDWLNKQSAGVYHFLLHWAYKGFPDFNMLLNDVNSLAMQQYDKGDFV
jgi:hypothetical protein